MRRACPTYATGNGRSTSRTNGNGGAGEALVSAAANAPVTKAQAVKNATSLKQMKSSLVSWLKFRALNDQVAQGYGVPKALLKRPGANTATASSTVIAERPIAEAQLASQLHALLSEVFDAGSLPDPDLMKNPDGAVQLAKIAVAGKLPGDATAPAAQGFVWLWPLVIIVGAIAYVITTQIRNSADVAKENERIACIEAGACTDTGFWLKFGAIAVGAWIIWDKFGVGVKVKQAMKGGRR